jgi:L-ascorbate metabolism protein UlaG (beta-lactamase superfamily)
MGKLTYFSHSAWMIESGVHRILIDPFLDDNPTSPVKARDVKPDFIIVTHAHGDHFGDTLAIAKNNRAMVIANFEIAGYCADHGVQSHGMHIGGSRTFPFGRVKFTPAWHGSTFPDGSSGGTPTGVLIMLEGKTIYHSGDTGLFSDMKLIAEMNPIDIAMIPIGDNFTMGLADAVKAVEFLKPKKVLPMHYQTFDVINSDPAEFKKLVQKLGVDVQVLKYGASMEF